MVDVLLWTFTDNGDIPAGLIQELSGSVIAPSEGGTEGMELGAGSMMEKEVKMVYAYCSVML